MNGRWYSTHAFWHNSCRCCFRLWSMTCCEMCSTKSSSSYLSSSNLKRSISNTFGWYCNLRICCWRRQRSASSTSLQALSLDSSWKQRQLSLDPAEASVVADWPSPSSQKQLRYFLGFTYLYCHFIQNYKKVVAPLTSLTSVFKTFIWTKEAKAAFINLKSLFTSASILVHPDPSCQFVVEVDASDIGFGAVLSQRDPIDQKLHPSTFFSWQLTPAKVNYDEILKSSLCYLPCRSGDIGWGGSFQHQTKRLVMLVVICSHLPRNPVLSCLPIAL